MKKKIHAGLDIGNSKIACLIAQSVDNNNIQIKTLGFGQHISMGINRGKVTDLAKLSNAITKAVEKAEEMAGFRISALNCNVSGGSPVSKIFRNSVKIQNDFIKKEDIFSLVNQNNDKNNYENLILLNKNQKKFIIDNNFEVDNPIGLKSSELSLETLKTYVDKNVVTNLKKTIELCHLSINKFYTTPEVTGISTMIQEERDHGAIVLDIGANLTSIAVFFKNRLVFSHILNIGGIHITSDLVKGIGTESNEAEKIKILHGSVDQNEADDFKTIQVKIISEKGELVSQDLRKSMLIAIIKPRVEEIFELIIFRLRKSYPEYSNVNRVILTGGTANLNGICNLAKSYFNCNVRIGKPIGLLNAPDILQAPSFSCLTGLVLKSSRESSTFDNNSFLNKIFKYFKTYL